MKDDRPRVLGLRASDREARLWRTFKAILTVIACLAAIWGVRSVYGRAANGFGFDFYQFWLGGDVLRAHQTTGTHEVFDMYTYDAHVKTGEQYAAMARTRSPRQREAAANRKVLDTASSPFFYWVFSILAPGDYDRDYKVYIVFSLTCMVGVIAALAWRLRYSVAGIGTALALAAISAPVYSDTEVANLNFPELAICCFYLFLRARARHSARFAAAWFLAGGAVMGLLAAFKPNLILFPVLLGASGLASCRWRGVLAEAGGFAAGVASAVAVSSLAFGGASCWLAWGEVILRLGARPMMPSEFGNFSLTRDLYETTGRNVIGLFSFVGMALAIGAIWLNSRARSRAPHFVGSASRTVFPGMPETVRSADPTRIEHGCLEHGPTAAAAVSAHHDIEFRHDLAIFGLAAAAALLSSGLAWVHYPILLFPFLLLVASRPWPGRISIPSEIVRYVLLSIVVILLLYPPLEEIRQVLPFRIPISLRAWLHCSQGAVAVTFGLGLWFESRLLGKMCIPITSTRQSAAPHSAIDSPRPAAPPA
jgi:hypothetical protein